MIRVNSDLEHVNQVEISCLCNLCETESEMYELDMKPSQFTLDSTRVAMTKKFAHVLV